MKNLNINRQELENIIERYPFVIIDKVNKDLWQIKQDDSIVNVYFKNNNKVSFLVQGKHIDIGLDIAKNLINLYNRGVGSEEIYRIGNTIII